MKFTLTFKTPDVLDQLADQIDDSDLLCEVTEELKERLRYGEYVHVEYDTETKELTVRE